LSEEPINQVLEYVKNDHSVMIGVDAIYYKLITEEHPTVHPFKYKLNENNTWVESSYSYDNNIVFVSRMDLVLPKNLYKTATYVVSKKNIELVCDYFEDDFIRTEIGNYIIFEPKNKDI
jgi:hypothetical protein